jgi:hypothetical protein
MIKVMNHAQMHDLRRPRIPSQVAKAAVRKGSIMIMNIGSAQNERVLCYETRQQNRFI